MTVADRVRREAEEIQKDWDTNPRWAGIQRDYTAEDVVRLRGSVRVEHSLARQGAERLWELLGKRDYVNALGALTRSTFRVGRSPATTTSPNRCTPIRASTRRTVRRRWCAESTTL
jgi:hypothetical protein